MAFALPAPLAIAADASQSKDCQLKQYDSIDLTVVDNVYVPVTIDGHAGFMSLNLGSGLSVFSEDAVATLGLKKEASPITAKVNKSDVTRLALFKSLSLGKVNFGKGSFLMSSALDEKAAALQPYFGTLGTEVFTIVDFELDLAHRKLTLFSQDHCKGNVVYWADSWGTAPLFVGETGTMYFPVELEGKKVEATLSPSNELTRLSTDVTQRLYGFNKSSPGIETGPAGDDGEPTAHYRAMQLTAPGMTVKNSRIRLADPPDSRVCSLTLHRRQGGGAGYTGCYNVYPMSLGRNVLASLRLYFATKEKMLYFTLADASRSAPAPAGDNPR